MAAMSDRAFIPVEEADAAISEIESMVIDTETGRTRAISLSALRGVRSRLGLPVGERLPDEGSRRSPRGSLRVNRRTDGELHD